MADNRVDVSYSLSNGWSATFPTLGEIRMGTFGQGLILTAPNGDRIEHFASQAVVVNDDTGALARSCITVSEDGQFGHIQAFNDFEWIVDFKARQIAPYRVRIHHTADGRHLSAFEQPAYRGVQSYARVGGVLYYVTFPFATDESFPALWDACVTLRKRQLDASYFADQA